MVTIKLESSAQLNEQQRVEDEVRDVLFLPLSELPAALVTGNALIDEEHRVLLGIMKQVRSICADPEHFVDCRACGTAKQATCEKDLINHLGDLFAFILDHFTNEERIMRDALLQITDQAQSEAHVEDHAAIAEKVQQIVARLDRDQVVERIRELDTLLATWISNHIGMHDMILVRSLAQHGELTFFSRKP